jgi:site-specific recombinase XerD
MKRTTKKVRGVFEKVPGSDIWWIHYTDADGRRRREKAGTKGNAIDLLAKRKNEALAGKKLPEKLRTPSVTFRQIADAALENSRQRKISHRHDETRMAPLLEQFGNRPAESILPEAFENWLSELAEKREWSIATKNRYIALLKLTYRLAEKNQKVKVNPARLLRMAKEDNAKVRYLNQYAPLPTTIDYLQDCQTEEDRLRAVIRTAYAEHLAEFEIALATGMRKSEMYRATWPNVDLEHHVLTVPKSKHGETRYVALNSTAVAVLEFLQARAVDGEHVFLSMRANVPLKGNKHWFEDAVERAGIKDFTWHCLRHTFGSRLAARGIDLRKIQELMGHKTLTVTVRYTHLSQPDLLAAVEQLASAPIPGGPTATRTATMPETATATSSISVQ